MQHESLDASGDAMTTIDPTVLAEFHYGAITVQAIHYPELQRYPYSRGGYQYEVHVANGAHPTGVRCNAEHSALRLFDYIVRACKRGHDVRWLFCHE